MGKIFYLMGKSSSGKDSLFKEIRKALPGLKEVVIYTTRPIREGETEGVEYHFVKEEDLQKLENAGKIIEVRAYQTAYGVWKYFTADDGNIRLDKASYVMIGTLESYEAMKQYFGEKKVVPIYVEVEDGIRLMRAIEREKQQEHPGYVEMCRRFLADSKDFSEERIKKAGIKRRFFNIDFETCTKEICQYITEQK